MEENRFMNPTDAPVATTVHPLEPLSAQELSSASALLRAEQDLGPRVRFVFVTLREPSKAQLAAWSDGASLSREAEVMVYDKETHTTFEATVDLTDRAVTEWRAVEGVQPPFMDEEMALCEAAVKADPRWQEAMRKRGVEDFELAMVDPWPASHTGPEDHPSRRRISRGLTWMRSEPGEHGYARPVEGLICVVDLDAMEVVEFEDHGVVPLPPKAGNYDLERMFREDNVPAFTELRQGVKPIEITQPEGPSFTVDGHHVRWLGWDLRLGFTPREGLVLHQIGYEDKGTLRPVIHRASLTEMYVPYGDPAPTHRFKNVFDQGELGIGWLANPLTLGCDCVGDITYFDGLVNDQDGNPLVVPNAVCMHEEDAGIAWKHTDFRTNEVEVRRLRRLVISFIATVGNYEYGYFWYLYNDGTIEYEIKLSGVLSTGAIPVGERPPYGTLVAPGLYGPNHQHFFCVRMDMAVDGPNNTVVEVDSEHVPIGPGNETGNAWRTVRNVLETEGQAQRLIDPLKGRFWRIESDRTSALGDPTSYKLMPGENVAPMYGPDADYAGRSGFTSAHLWVTKFDADERFGAGEYPNQHPGGTGLPAFAASDEAIVDEDIVVWYVFGAHHVPRPEDWPVMPVAHIGFKLKPAGFFDGNPALDMPPSEEHCGHHPA
jgi:primary-amine oxidase